MKLKRLGIMLVLAVVVCMTPACKKKSEDPQPEEETTPATAGSFTAKVDGVAKSYPVNYYYLNSGILVVNAAETTGASAGIALMIFQGKVGTFTINGSTIMGYYTNGAKDDSKSGQIVISKLENNKVSGTFNFVTQAGVKVTDGAFTEIAIQ